MRYVLAGAAALGATISPAHSQNLTTEYGINLITIGAARNRDATLKEAPGLEFLPSGGVDYEYRIGQTELTTSQWLEFVSAYGPHWAAQGNNPRDFSLTGEWIDYIAPAGQPPSAPGGTYVIVPGAEQWPTNMGWRFAARYCNWLHNGKVDTPEAFESGAYDASTFTENPNGSLNDQIAHSPGARFWLPTFDEFIKAMYYDPDRYGDGIGGYWLFPNGSDEQMISGLPEDDGETPAGVLGLAGFPVAQYPWVQSPWGLLDGSGGAGNWTETVAYDRARYFLGSWTGDILYMLHDRLDSPGAFSPPGPVAGFRIAGVVPTSGSACVLVMGVIFTARRRRYE